MMTSSSETSLRLGFFTYPWDLVKEGAGHAIGSMAGELHCNAIYLNACYHHARTLHPRWDGPKTYFKDAALAAFRPQAHLYGEAGLLPVIDEDLADSGVLLKTQELCRSQNMDFGAWVVGLHNSSLGETNPHLCVENCFGDIYTYALCPSQPDNRGYLVGLVRDVCTQFEPDRVALEAVGALGLRHWVHHELFLTEWDESLELLTEICFCPACQATGRNNGVDVESLRQRVARLAERLLNDERGGLPASFSAGDSASLLVEIDGLQPYLDACTDSVTELVRHCYQVASRLGAALEVIPASFHRPASRAWLERVSIADVALACDGMLIPSYFNSAAEVEADLKWASYLAPDATLVAGLNACAPMPNEATLDAQAAACVTAGCRGIYYYNYGLLNHRRLEWVARANRSILEGNR